MAFNLEDYETVESRIKRFYEDHEDGSITTQLISPVENISQAIFKAFIYIGDKIRATGYAVELDGKGFVNKTCHLENSETSAIGRALANFNYSGSKRPSREEMEKVSRSSDMTKKLKQQAQEHFKQILEPDDKLSAWIAAIDEHTQTAIIKGINKMASIIQGQTT